MAPPETKSYLRLPLDTVGIKGRTYSLVWSKRSAENRFWVAKAVELFASLFRFGLLPLRGAWLCAPLQL